MHSPGSAEGSARSRTEERQVHGIIYQVVDGRLAQVQFPGQPTDGFNTAALAAVLDELNSYSLAMDTFPAFHRLVYRSLLQVPAGKTISYKNLAAAAGNPLAARAAANACARNPVPLRIPCHRVIATDGSLGGFSSGLQWKTRLLELESQLVANT